MTSMMCSAAPTSRNPDRRSEIAVPRLVLGAGKRDVEARFHDLVVRPQYRSADCSYPWVGRKVDETPNALRVYFYLTTVRPSVKNAVWAPRGFGEQHVDIFPQTRDPRAAERALEGGNSVAVQAAHDRSCVEFVPAREEHCVHTYSFCNEWHGGGVTDTGTFVWMDASEQQTGLSRKSAVALEENFHSSSKRQSNQRVGNTLLPVSRTNSELREKFPIRSLKFGLSIADKCSRAGKKFLKFFSSNPKVRSFAAVIQHMSVIRRLV